MTDFSDVPLIATGDWIDAAFINQYWGDNFRAIMQGYANAGSMAYAIDADTIGELAKPAEDAYLMNTNSGVPEWVRIPGVVHAKAIGTYDPASQAIGSTSYVDVTNATLNIVTTRPCTILMIATGRIGSDDSNKNAYARPVINGSAPSTDAGSAVQLSTGIGIFPFTVLHMLAGVAAGTITCKIQGKIAASGGNAYFGVGTIILIALED